MIGSRAVGRRSASGALLRIWYVDLQGWPRRPVQARALVAGVVTWVVLGGIATYVSAGRLESELGFDPLPALAGVAILVFGLAPLIGGSGAEAASARELARFPVRPASVFWSAWVQSLLDVQLVLLAPIVLGLAVDAGGPGAVGSGPIGAELIGAGRVGAGLLGGVAFLAAVSGMGVVTGYSGAGLAGRLRRPALAVVAAVGALTGAVALVSALTDLGAPELVERVGRVVPALARGAPWAWLGIGSVLVGLQLLGPAAVGLAWRTDARGGRVDQPTGRLRVRSIPAVLVVAELRSMLRPVPVRLSLVSMLAVPLLALAAPGEPVTVAAIAPIVVLALAVVLAANGFAFVAGGVSVLAAAPVRASRVLGARFVASALVIGSASVASTGVSLLVMPIGAAATTVVVAALGQLAACCGVTLWTSVRWPAFADYESVRVRPAPVTSLGAALVVCLPVATAIGVLGGAGPLGGLAGLALGLVVALVAVRGALRGCDLEHVAAAVR